MTENAKVAKRRQREKLTISYMIALYCKGNHREEPKSKSSYCGEEVCLQCAQLDAYAVLRTQRCRKMEEKTSCEECENHCYAPEMRKQIREVMRYSGPRMLLHHPIAAFRHVMGK